MRVDSPSPLSPASCSHNALGQECKRQLRPPITEVAAEGADWVARGHLAIKGENGEDREASGPVPGRYSPMVQGSKPPGLGSLAGNSWVLLSTPTTVGTAGPLFPCVTFMPIPDDSSETDSAERSLGLTYKARQGQEAWKEELGRGVGGRAEHKARGK